MAQSPEMRASDVDRDRVAGVLREHTAQGRITMDEFNERLEQLYQSKTYGELARLTADLPDVDLRNPPAELPGRTPAPQERHALGDARGLGRVGRGELDQLGDLADREHHFRAHDLSLAAVGDGPLGCDSADQHHLRKRAKAPVSV